MLSLFKKQTKNFKIILSREEGRLFDTFLKSSLSLKLFYQSPHE